MNRNKKLILSAAALLIVLLALFLPGLIWGIHQKELYAWSEERDYDITRVTEEPTPLDVSNAFYDPGRTVYTDQIDTPAEMLPQRKEEDLLILNEYLKALDPDDRVYLMKLLEEAQPLVRGESTLFVQSESGMMSMELVNSRMEVNNKDENFQLTLDYEKRTGVVCSFAIQNYDMIEETEVPSRVEYKSLIQSADSYYAELGIAPERYQIAMDEYSLQINLCEQEELSDSEY